MAAKERLVSRYELSRRLTTVKKTTIYKQCAEGGRLYAAMVGARVDLEHINAKIFCAEFGYVEPDIVEERKKAAAQAVAKVKAAPRYVLEYAAHDLIPPDEPAANEDPDDTPEAEMFATRYMDLSLKDLVRRYGKQSQFKELVTAYKVLVGTQAAEEKMARDRKEFAHFSHIERLAMHIDGLHKMLITDAAKNIADTAKTLAAAGANDGDVRRAVTKVLEQVITMAKAQSDKIIRSAKR